MTGFLPTFLLSCVRAVLLVINCLHTVLVTAARHGTCSTQWPVRLKSSRSSQPFGRAACRVPGASVVAAAIELPAGGNRLYQADFGPSLARQPEHYRAQLCPPPFFKLLVRVGRAMSDIVAGDQSAVTAAGVPVAPALPTLTELEDVPVPV